MRIRYPKPQSVPFSFSLIVSLLLKELSFKLLIFATIAAGVYALKNDKDIKQLEIIL